MADDLLDNYNPLYDVHLQQYFASPHMQKHLRRIGLLRDRSEYEEDGDNEVYERHNVMMDLLLKNREKQLAKLAALQKKLDAAEKVEICRKIRSGQTPGTQPRARPSRSLSRGRKAASRSERRSSTSTDDKDLIKRIESEGEETPRANATVYSRLSASVAKYRYLHKLDDHTLSAYMEELRKQLRRLERFRDVSFGPHSVARHPSEPQESWFFRRRSLPSFSDSGHANSVHEHLRKMRSGQFANSPTLRNLNETNDNETKDIFAGGKQQYYRLPKIRCSDKTSAVNKNFEPILLPVNRSASKPRSSRSTSKKRNEPIRVQKIKTGPNDTKASTSLEVFGTPLTNNERRKPRESIKTITKKTSKPKPAVDDTKRKRLNENIQKENGVVNGRRTVVPLSDTFVKPTPLRQPMPDKPLQPNKERIEIEATLKQPDVYNENIKQVLKEFAEADNDLPSLTDERIDILAKIEEDIPKVREKTNETVDIKTALQSSEAINSSENLEPKSLEKTKDKGAEIYSEAGVKEDSSESFENQLGIIKESKTPEEEVTKAFLTETSRSEEIGDEKGLTKTVTPVLKESPKKENENEQVKDNNELRKEENTSDNISEKEIIETKKVLKEEEETELEQESEATEISVSQEALTFEHGTEVTHDDEDQEKEAVLKDNKEQEAIQRDEDSDEEKSEINAFRSEGTDDLTNVLSSNLELQMIPISDEVRTQKTSSDILDEETEGASESTGVDLPAAHEDETTEKQVFTKDHWDDTSSEKPDTYMTEGEENIKDTYVEVHTEKTNEGYKTSFNELLDQNKSAMNLEETETTAPQKEESKITVSEFISTPINVGSLTSSTSEGGNIRNEASDESESTVPLDNSKGEKSAEIQESTEESIDVPSAEIANISSISIASDTQLPISSEATLDLSLEDDTSKNRILSQTELLRQQDLEGEPITNVTDDSLEVGRKGQDRESETSVPNAAEIPLAITEVSPPTPEIPEVVKKAVEEDKVLEQKENNRKANRELGLGKVEAIDLEVEKFNAGSDGEDLEQTEDSSLMQEKTVREDFKTDSENTSTDTEGADEPMSDYEENEKTLQSGGIIGEQSIPAKEITEEGEILDNVEFSIKNEKIADDQQKDSNAFAEKDEVSSEKDDGEEVAGDANGKLENQYEAERIDTEPEPMLATSSSLQTSKAIDIPSEQEGLTSTYEVIKNSTTLKDTFGMTKDEDTSDSDKDEPVKEAQIQKDYGKTIDVSNLKVDGKERETNVEETRETIEDIIKAVESQHKDDYEGDVSDFASEDPDNNSATDLTVKEFGMYTQQLAKTALPDTRPEVEKEGTLNSEASDNGITTNIINGNQTSVTDVEKEKILHEEHVNGTGESKI